MAGSCEQDTNYMNGINETEGYFEGSEIILAKSSSFYQKCNMDLTAFEP